MTFSEMEEAIKDAKSTINIADNFIASMAGFIVGKLQSGRVSDYNLKQLKKELARYNIHTGSWRQEG